MTSQPDTGRPLKFETPAELQQKIDEFFADCDPHISIHKVKVTGAEGGKFTWRDEEFITEQKPYTITGLALALDTSRQTLLNYESPDYHSNIAEPLRQAFIDTIKKAKLKCHAFSEGRLYSGQMVAGVIFALKNNFEWKDSKELVGKDGAPLIMTPEAAAAMHDALEEIANGRSGKDASAIPGAAEPTGV